MITPERALFDAFVKAADGHQRDAVVGAAANLLANAMRQSHRLRGEAEEELDALVANIKRAIAQHYGEDGRRKERSIVLPPINALLDLAG